MERRGRSVLAVAAVAAVSAGSVALAGFGLDSLIEIGASAVVVRQLKGASEAREGQATRLIGWGFIGLALYLFTQPVYVFVAAGRPDPSASGIAWTAPTAAVMTVLAYGKTVHGAELPL